MLSLDTVHALVDQLLQLDTPQPSPATKRFRDLGTLALIQDYPIPDGPPERRGMRALQVPLLTDHRRHQTLPASLHAIADALTGVTTRENRLLAAPLDPFELDILRQELHQPGSALRLLAWAVCYDDLLTDAGLFTRVRRVEALDADGRVYQFSRTTSEDHPVVLVDEQPNPADLPATYPGLARLAMTSHQSTT